MKKKVLKTGAGKKRYIKKPFKEGDWVDDWNCGRELKMDDLENMIGELVVVDYSTFSHPWHKVVRVKSIVKDGNTEHSRRLTYSDGTRSFGSISESFIDGAYDQEGKLRAYVFKLAKKGARHDR